MLSVISVLKKILSLSSEFNLSSSWRDYVQVFCETI